MAYLLLFIHSMNKILFALIFLSLSSWSADLSLFLENGNFNEEFAKQILSGDLKDGESIHLIDRSLTFKKILGSGNTTLILKVQNPETGVDFALRLPHGNTEKRYHLSDGMRFINHTFNGYEELNDAGLPIPKIHDYNKDHYLLVDIIEHDFSLRTFLARNNTFTEESKERALKSLIEFSKETALFDSIGDFHLEQAVYSKDKNKWFLLDWASGHQLARQPSSPNVFSSFLFYENNIALDGNGNEIYEINRDGHKIKVAREISEFEKAALASITNAIEEQRRVQTELDNLELDRIKQKLSTLSDHKEVLEVYKNIHTKHLASFFTLLQKDFIANQLEKFPRGALGASELDLLMNHLGKFTPYFFSQFAEKIIDNIYDLETFNHLYVKLQTIGLDEELEDDIAGAIARNMERLLRNTTNDPKILDSVEKLKNDYGLINYMAKEHLANAAQYLKPATSCRDVISSFL
ncbi:hypothetical protein BMS_2493 [Halobacteriovorax marinus SJ]|uniref:Uncharacterized protein n=2 Tax=Halobacteriovorax marinus TaxID=97084 RepID=E1X5G3_HALMS|nr:hypothetical protein BMS_2493 [Halobacteriovorax marinus SJ]